MLDWSAWSLCRSSLAFQPLDKIKENRLRVYMRTGFVLLLVFFHSNEMFSVQNQYSENSEC